ncbi:MAG: competence/damage-inducible protein A [Candidatus Aminicenantales bacterium]
MRIGIVAVGSELLTPFYQDTDSLFLTRRLNELGLKVDFKVIVGDERENLKLVLEEAIKKADLLFITGGLGPTEDDRTREVLSEVLGKKLVFQPEILAAIEERFRHRGMEMPPANRKQAYLLEGAQLLANRVGTAAGQWVEINEKRIVVLPGPPHELQAMFEESVWPRLQPFRQGCIHRRVLKISGLTESQVEDQIGDLYPQQKEIGITLLAYPGQIEIHLSSSAETELQARHRMEPLIARLEERLGINVFSREGEELEEVVGGLLRSRQLTLALAESCTGGLLGHRITSVPGSSAYFLEAAVVYSNSAKIRSLGVSEALISQHGAVSAEVAREMAAEIRRKSGADLGLSITGIAGPAGGSVEKPVGLVFIGLASGSEVQVSGHRFLGSRQQIKFQATQKALDLLRRYLLGQSQVG